jgi:hypothetical protein
MIVLLARAFVWSVAILLLLPLAAEAAGETSASNTAAGASALGDWPRTTTLDGVELNIYQPQPSSWDGYRFRASAAVMAEEPPGGPQTFGAIQIDATTIVNKDTRTVTFDQIQISNARFPSVPDKAARWQKLLADYAARGDAPVRTLELDRLEASLAINNVQSQAVRDVKNDPPNIVFANAPTLLIYVDGSPIWQAVPKLPLERVMNTRPLLLRARPCEQKPGCPIYLKLFDGWLEAPALEGPWTVTLHPPAELDKALKWGIENKLVDPLPGTTPDDTKTKPPSLKVNPPRIIIATKPTELIVTTGQPQWVPVPNTELLFVENTTGHVFKNTKDQATYVLTSGRWFKAPSEAGPWAFIAGTDLPKDFRAIPDDSPKENVKASVPGTPQADEAVIANSVPQTAKVDKKKAVFSPKMDGEPRFEPVEGTPLQRVVNSSSPILRVDEKSFYAVENGVWFVATSLAGPWVVAESVPAVIYSIPASSPVYYVTYVKVYEVTPTTVIVGYTPGYYGTYVSNGVVVYGTGYYYTPWVGTAWYGPPVTYGFGVNVAYTPWTGWSMGFCYGWGWGSVSMSFGGWGYGPYPWWGPVGVGFYGPAAYPWRYGAGGAAWGPRPGSGAVWGPGGWAGSTGNVYHRWGPTTAVTRSSGGYNAWTGNQWSQDVGRSYNSRTGTLAAGQRSSVGNIYSGNYRSSASGAAINERTGGAAVGGRVTTGNAYTGSQQTVSAGAVRNPRTGEVTTGAAVKGNNGGVARVGNDVYVGNDGNVARVGAGGNWQEPAAGGGWKDSSMDAGRSKDLDKARNQRTEGERRHQGFSGGGHRAAGFGGGRGRR